MTYVIKIIKKIIFSCFLLYGYNVLALPINTIIPINIFTILIITIFDFPSLFVLILIKILLF